MQKLFGFKTNQINLVILSILTGLILLGSEASYDNSRMIYDTDHFNNLKLVDSAVKALESGQFIIRTSEGLFHNAGVPFHQFYSPGAHGFIALWVILTQDLMFGYSIALLFMSTLAFIYSFKLCRYLTHSNLASITGSFIFVTAPYLACVRVLRGAIPEYMAICVLPMVLYFHIRAVSSGKPIFILKAVISTSWLFLLHLITASFFYFFLSVFFFFYLIYNIIFITKFKVKFLLHTLKKLKIIFYIISLIILLDNFYLFPLFFYNDLIIKTDHINIPIYLSNFFVPILSIFSIRDMISPSVYITPTRLQIGFLLFAGYLAFIYFRKHFIKSQLAWPLILTSSFILYIIIQPVIFVGPLKFLNFAQFSYRFLAQFQVIAMLMGVLALIVFWRESQNSNYTLQISMSLIIILASLIFIIPYIFPSVFKSSFPKYISDEQVFLSDEVYLSTNLYTRKPPTSLDNTATIPLFSYQDIIKAKTVNNSADHIFEIDLERINTQYFNNNEILLDVLYFPGLMEIKTLLNGSIYHPNIATYWRQGTFNYIMKGQKYSFHGLKISNLPNKGLLTVHVKFIGYKTCNYISFITLLSTILYLTIMKLKFKT
jgi:hypothetical protein